MGSKPGSLGSRRGPSPRVVDLYSYQYQQTQIVRSAPSPRLPMPPRKIYGLPSSPAPSARASTSSFASTLASQDQPDALPTYNDLESEFKMISYSAETRQLNSSLKDSDPTRFGRWRKWIEKRGFEGREAREDRDERLSWNLRIPNDGEADSVAPVASQEPGVEWTDSPRQSASDIGVALTHNVSAFTLGSRFFSQLPDKPTCSAFLPADGKKLGELRGDR